MNEDMHAIDDIAPSKHVLPTTNRGSSCDPRRGDRWDLTFLFSLFLEVTHSNRSPNSKHST